MVEQTCFLVFSDDWGEHPSCCQHIFKYICRNHRVLWVNTIGMRNIKLSKRDLEKAIVKGRKMLGADRWSISGNKMVKPENLEVVQPLMLPFVTLPGVRWMNARSVIWRVRKALNTYGMSRPILISTVPNVSDYLGSFGEQRVVYYCVDDFAEWPGLLHRMVREMEEDLVGKSDCIIATSEMLCAKFEGKRKPVSLLSHGVDIDHFNSDTSAEHHLLQSIPLPRIGYFGLFDERNDQYLLRDLALANPHVSIVITGNVVVNVEDLQKLPNVYFIGPVGYEDLPAVVAGWKMCILPYKDNVQTSTINPLKIKEYIATGLPVLSTPIPGVMSLKDHIKLCALSEDWVREVRDILAKNDCGRKKNVKEALRSEAWENKASEFIRLCC